MISQQVKCLQSAFNPLFLFTPCTDKQNALRRECIFKIEIVLEIGVAGVNNHLFKDTSFDNFGCSSSTSSVG